MELTGDDLAISLAFWGVSAASALLVVGEIRRSDSIAALVYACIAVALLVCGFVWQEIGYFGEEFVQAWSERIFFLGFGLSALIYAIARKRFFKSEQPFMANVGEGLAGVVFLFLMLAPFLDKKLVLEVFAQNLVVFGLAGFGGLAMLVSEIRSRQSNNT